MKKYSLWITEFVIWLLIIVVSVFAVRFYNVSRVAKKNTYHIFLKDIDGLMKGSPVKIMGVQVGYVTEINVIDDYMYVSFFISKPDITIPHGSKAMIESYGIAGSKSIELYPPEEKADETQDILFVKEPIRASTSFKTQNVIAKALIAVSEGTTAMLDTQTVEQHKLNIQKIAEISGSDCLNIIDEKSEAMLNLLQKNTKNDNKNESSIKDTEDENE